MRLAFLSKSILENVRVRQGGLQSYLHETNKKRTTCGAPAGESQTHYSSGSSEFSPAEPRQATILVMSMRRARRMKSLFLECHRRRVSISHADYFMETRLWMFLRRSICRSKTSSFRNIRDRTPFTQPGVAHLASACLLLHARHS